METETKQKPFNIGRNAQKRWFRAWRANIRRGEVATATACHGKAPKLKNYKHSLPRV